MNILYLKNNFIFGNDIVDLKDPDASIEHLNERFINKICTPKEKQFFFYSFKQDITYNKLLWSIWSLKESGYKAISRIYHIPYFRYKDYEISENLKNIIYKDFILNNFIYSNDLFIFSVVYSNNKSFLKNTYIENDILISWIKKLDNNQNKNHSLLIRKYIYNSLLNIFNLKSRIVREYDSKNKIYLAPYIYIHKNYFPISLSHHGKYISFTLSMDRNAINLLLEIYKNKIKFFNNHYIIFDL